MLMNLFNIFNCRKLGVKEFNIFSGLQRNLLFIIIMIGEFLIQYAFIIFHGKIFYTDSLSMAQHITALCLGLGSWAVAAAVKATPVEWLDKIKFQLNEDGSTENMDYISKMHARFSGQLQRSQTEKLLDSK